VRSILLCRKEKAAQTYLQSIFADFASRITIREVDFQPGARILSEENVYQQRTAAIPPSQFRTMNPNDPVTPMKVYIAEEGNEELWFLRLFEKRRMVSHVKVSIIRNGPDHVEVLTELLKETRSLGIFENPTLVGVHEAQLYENIDSIFENYKKVAQVYYRPPPIISSRLQPNGQREELWTTDHIESAAVRLLNNDTPKFDPKVHLDDESMYNINWNLLLRCCFSVLVVIASIALTELIQGVK